MAITPTLRLLQENDERDAFDCGKDSLNTWFHRHAWRNQVAGVSRTYVIEDEVTHSIKAYMSLAAGDIHRTILPKSQQRNMPDPIPIILLAQLAVDKQYQGQHLSKYLLAGAFNYALKAADIIGGFALVTHPLDEQVRSFYQRWGFETLEADPHRSMYVRVRDIRASLAP